MNYPEIEDFFIIKYLIELIRIINVVGGDSFLFVLTSGYFLVKTKNRNKKIMKKVHLFKFLK